VLCLKILFFVFFAPLYILRDLSFVRCRSGQLSSDQIDEYVKDARNELGVVKDKLDKNKELKEEEMFKRMSQSKRKSLAEEVSLDEVDLS